MTANVYRCMIFFHLRESIDHMNKQGGEFGGGPEAQRVDPRGKV